MELTGKEIVKSMIDFCNGRTCSKCELFDTDGICKFGKNTINDWKQEMYHQTDTPHHFTCEVRDDGIVTIYELDGNGFVQSTQFEYVDLPGIIKKIKNVLNAKKVIFLGYLYEYEKEYKWSTDLKNYKPSTKCFVTVVGDLEDIVPVIPRKMKFYVERK